MDRNQIVNNAYRLDEQLGKSPWAETWLASAEGDFLKVPAGTSLVVKILAIGSMLSDREKSALNESINLWLENNRINNH